MPTALPVEVPSGPPIHPLFASFARRSLAGEALSRDEARAVLHTADEELGALLQAAYAVRQAQWGNRVKVCVLQNARSGLCPEDCGYCSQSSVSTAEIETYRLLSQEKLVAAAERAIAEGARRYCMVTSGRGPSERDIEHLCAATRTIKSEHPELEVCVSLGILDEAKARRLQEAGVGWVNHNLNTSERFHPEICSTHDYADRVSTIRAAKQAGLQTCCGGIIGMGEEDDDVVELGFALRELEVDSLPLNFLHPIGGTPLGDRTPVEADRALRALCLMRFLNPAADIRAAGGRERTLGEWQALALYPANSIFVNGYLTTPGQASAEARRMVEGWGFTLEEGLA
ncbi:MAG: biotin synthase BioB [Deltaproteobacteria bacterium]|nr:biotin synthase BioB [Deltaproteobacteria bacterium]